MNYCRGYYSPFFISCTRKIFHGIWSFSDTPRYDYFFCTGNRKPHILHHPFQDFPKYLFPRKDSSCSNCDPFYSSVLIFCASLYCYLHIFERFFICTLSLLCSYTTKYFCISYSYCPDFTVSVLPFEYLYKHCFSPFYEYGSTFYLSLSSLFHELPICTFWPEYRCLLYIYSLVYSSLLDLLYTLCCYWIWYCWKYFCSYRGRREKPRTWSNAQTYLFS